MAARQQPKGTGLAIQYEDLVPKSEWKDQPEATLITIDLPGFSKEQIKVTYVHASKMIRVTGERPLANRKWSRFNEVFTVPQNCLVDKIHGSFKNNVLTITMPKEKLANIPEASKTVAEKVEKMEKLEEKRLWEESRRKEEAEKKRTKELMEEKEALIKKLQEEAKAKEKAEAAKKLEEEVRAKKKLEEEAKAKEKAEAAKKLEEEVRAKKKLEEEAKAEAAKKLEEEEVRAKKKLEEEKKLVEEARLIEKKSVDESGGKWKIVKPEERKLPEVVYTKPGTGTGIGTGSGSKPGLGGVGEVVKTAEEKVGYLVEKEKKIGKGIMEKIRKKEITSEEKKLMVNVGVAALVIFALGAYVSYTLCSSSSSSSSSSPSPSSSSSSTKLE